MRASEILRLKGVALLLAFALLAAGCGGRGAVAETPGTGSVSGIVRIETLKAMPGDPGNLRVYLKERPDLETRTTSLGSYTIPSIPPGRYTVVLVLPDPPKGAVHTVQPAGAEWKNVEVRSGLQTVNVDFQVDEVPAPPGW